MSIGKMLWRLGLALTVSLVAPSAPGSQGAMLAIVGCTVIDGNGGPPLPDAVALVRGSRISLVGPRASVRIPDGATVIDAKGGYALPGFIDTNVHLSLYGGVRDRYETLVRYHSRQDEIVLEAAQLQLKNGVTTVRDSYGMLMPLVQTRDAIARGQAVGARILAAGNILGWGGPYSVSFSLIPERDLTLFQEQMNDAIAQGGGEDLMDMSPEELRVAINKYLDKGPDFLKYGGTSHFSQPTLIGFSPEAQKVIVEEAHKRGRVAETHSTTIEGLRLSILAGIDLIQHPEILTPREAPDDLVRLIRERKVICSMLVNTMTGEAWRKHLKTKEEAQKKLQEAEKKGDSRAKTSAEERRRDADLGVSLEVRRRNAQKLIQAGCVVTVGTDNYWGAAPELSREPKPEHQNHGIGTIIGIEGLVEFLDYVIEELPFPIQRVQTDRGMEFFAYDFQQRLMDYAIKFRPIKPRSPHLNGKVERSQKTDWDEFYSTVDFADPDLNEKLRQWQDYYNHERPHGSLGNQTPWEKWWGVTDKTPLTEEVEAMYDPTKERFREQNYRADLVLQKLKGCQ